MTTEVKVGRNACALITRDTWESSQLDPLSSTTFRSSELFIANIEIRVYLTPLPFSLFQII